MSWNFESVAIVGSGAIGLYYGARLAQSGKKVRFLTRSDFDKISDRGIRVESVSGDFQLRDVSVHKSTGEIGPVDLVIVSWKATANDHLATVLPPLLHKNTQVLTLQNGLGNCEAIAAIVGPDRVLGGLCYVCINRTAPGVIQHTAGGKVSIGEFGKGEEHRAETIASAFKDANIPASAVSDLVKAQWEKLVWNIPFNGIAFAEGGVTTDILLTQEKTVEQIRELMREVIATARTQGIDLSDDLVEKNIELTRHMGAYRPSTMIDFIEGRELELGPIWEEPLKRAAQAGISTPALEHLLAQMKQRLDEKLAGNTFT